MWEITFELDMQFVLVLIACAYKEISLFDESKD